MSMSDDDIQDPEASASAWAALAHLDFPLNVYAIALGLEEGHVDALHYGVFDEAVAEPISVAQARATDFLLRACPPAPARILEVGIGLGKTLERLSKDGYHVEGITPDSHQVAMAREGMPSVFVEEGKFEQASRAPDSYDVILFQESAQYIDRELLLHRSFEWLCVGGHLLIMDEVPSAEVPLWTASSRRLGFRERCFVDYTTAAAPSVDALVRGIDKHREEIERRLDVSPVRLFELLTELKRRRVDYRLGRHRYVLFHWEKCAPDVCERPVGRREKLRS